MCTETTEIHLNTERRHEERLKSNQERLEHEQERSEIERQKQLRREQEEEEMVRQLRRNAVHHAQPIRNYRQVQIHPSEKPPTIPETPKFSHRTRRSNQQA